MFTEWENFAVPEYHLLKLHKWREGEAPPILKPDTKWKKEIIVILHS